MLCVLVDVVEFILCRIGALVPVVYAAAVWVCDVLRCFSTFSCVLSIPVLMSCDVECGACVNDRVE